VRLLRLTGAFSSAPLVRFGYFGLFLAACPESRMRGLLTGQNCHQLFARR